MLNQIIGLQVRIDAAVLHNVFNAAYWIFISLIDVSFCCYLSDTVALFLKYIYIIIIIQL